MLDETWGLIDGEDKETSTPRVERNHGPIDDQFKKDFDGGHFKFIYILNRQKAFQKIIIYFGSDRLELLISLIQKGSKKQSLS